MNRHAAWAFITSVMLLAASAVVRADDTADASRLYQALLMRQPSSLPRGFSSARVSTTAMSEDEKNAGAVGAVLVTLVGGGEAQGNYRFTVFSNPQRTRAFGDVFSQRLTASGQSRGFLPFLPDAECVSQAGNQLCGLASRNVFVITSASGIQTANTHEGQTVVGVSAGTLLRGALDHLEAIRKSLGTTSANRPAH
jgi:hypothetical protein